MDNSKVQTSVFLSDVPTQKDWYRQQIPLYKDKVKVIKGIVREAKNDLFVSMEKHTRAIYKLQHFGNTQNYDQYKSVVDKTYEEMMKKFFWLTNVLSKYYITCGVLEELIKENKKLYSCGGFYE